MSAVPTTTITFTAGQTTKTVNVTVKGDNAAESNETFNLNLSTPVGVALADAAATGTIVNNDGAAIPAPVPYVAVGDKWVKEGNTGTVTVPVTVGLSWAAASTVSVQVSTANGTAGAADFTALAPTTVSFTAGQTSKTVNISVKNDTAHEANETFQVKLTALTGVAAGDTTATVTILDDDGPLSLGARDTWVLEGQDGTRTAVFNVQLSAPQVGQNVTVSVATSTANGSTATAGTDYVALSATTLTFTPGQTSKTVAVTVKGDEVDEPNEKISLVLSSPSGATVADTVAQAFIVDDD